MYILHPATCNSFSARLNSPGRRRPWDLTKSPWTPARLNPTLWLDTDDLAGTEILSWADRSGNDNHATGVTEKVPTHQSDVGSLVNGHSVARYSAGTTEKLTTPSMAFATSKYVIFMAIKVSGAAEVVYLHYGAGGVFVMGSPGVVLGGVPLEWTMTAGVRIIALVQTGGSMAVYLDGALIGEPSNAGLASLTLDVGGDGQTSCGADVLSVIMVGGDMTPANRALTENWLARKYGV